MVDRTARAAHAAGHVGITLTEEARKLLAEEGFDPTLGARPLRRAIQRLVEDPLSEQILGGQWQAGDVIEVVRRGRRASRSARARASSRSRAAAASRRRSAAEAVDAPRARLAARRRQRRRRRGGRVGRWRRPAPYGAARVRRAARRAGMGRCSECGEFGTFVEEIEQPAATPVAGCSCCAAAAAARRRRAHRRRRASRPASPSSTACSAAGSSRGSLVLLGGEPGIGKSTLLLQAADALGAARHATCSTCAARSRRSRSGMRAERLGAARERVRAAAGARRRRRRGARCASAARRARRRLDPDGVRPRARRRAGQRRARCARAPRGSCASRRTSASRRSSSGTSPRTARSPGPRVLEHMVDTVLYFEGDRDHAFRIVRAVKNRFGSSSEIGIFEMGERGLVGVGSPSAALLAERAEPVAGSAVMAAMEGSRPLLVEIQALVTPSYLPVPRRLATGIETARLLQVLAVLERRAGLSFAGQDVYVSVAGGVRVAEPAVDLPLALALASALTDVPLPLDVAAFGELGLTGTCGPVRRRRARQGSVAVSACSA